MRFYIRSTILFLISFLLLPGKPLPKVLWYMDDSLLDDTYQQTYEGTVKNGLSIKRLERQHSRGRLRCVAYNNNITRPVETETRIKMLCEYEYNCTTTKCKIPTGLLRNTSSGYLVKLCDIAFPCGTVDSRL